jgi:rhodanese-related sulfurtransferase
MLDGGTIHVRPVLLAAALVLGSVAPGHTAADEAAPAEAFYRLGPSAPAGPSGSPRLACQPDPAEHSDPRAFRVATHQPASMASALSGDEAPVARRHLSDAPVCYLTAVQLADLPGVMLVDVRRAQDFARYHIPGSINIPAFALKTKPFLKERTLVLVDDGRRPRRLEATCRDLRRRGFRQVRVLHGGLRAWRHALGPLTGDELARAELGRLMPADLVLEQDQARWRALNLAGGDASPLSEVFDISDPLDEEHRGSFADALREAVETELRRFGSSRDVLLVAADDERDAEFARQVAGRDWPQVYYLAGGLAGYRDHLARQQAIWARAGRPARPPARCGVRP